MESCVNCLSANKALSAYACACGSPLTVYCSSPDCKCSINRIVAHTPSNKPDKKTEKFFCPYEGCGRSSDSHQGIRIHSSRCQYKPELDQIKDEPKEKTKKEPKDDKILSKKRPLKMNFDEGDFSRRSARRKSSSIKFDNEMTNKEVADLQHAMRASQASQKMSNDHEIPPAPVYRPTLEEFKDPIAYIKKIEPEACKFGICRIVPPAEWKEKVRPVIDPDNPKDSNFTFKTRSQTVNRLQEALGFDVGGSYNVSSYKKMSDEFKVEYIMKKLYKGNINPKNATKEDIESIISSVSLKDLEEEYWRVVETSPYDVQAEYGNDIDTSEISGSGFEYLFTSEEEKMLNENSNDKRIQRAYAVENSSEVEEKYSGCQGWNLNLISAMPGCALRHVSRGVSGVNVPWLYCGMLFSSFCWHTEDDFLHSINYSHCGAPKKWYGIPGHKATKFERILSIALSHLFDKEPDLMLKLVTQVSPRFIMANAVPVYTTTQYAGDFVITFPRGYHAGFSYGFNIGEAVNFATDNWFRFARNATNEYRKMGRYSVCSYEYLLLASILNERKDHDMEILLPELRQSFKIDRSLRAMCSRQGVKTHARMPNAWEKNLSYFSVNTDIAPTIASCSVCLNNNYFSFLQCIYCLKTYCLGHVRATCHCNQSDNDSLDNIRLLYRYTVLEQNFIMEYAEQTTSPEMIKMMEEKEEAYKMDAIISS